VRRGDRDGGNGGGGGRGNDERHDETRKAKEAKICDRLAQVSLFPGKARPGFAFTRVDGVLCAASPRSVLFARALAQGCSQAGLSLSACLSYAGFSRQTLQESN